MNTKYFINSIEDKALLPIYKFVTSPNFLISLLVVAVMLALIFSYSASGISSSGEYIKHLYTESNGNQHILGFKICAGNIDLHNAKVLVNSDSQTITVTSDDTINVGKCSKTFGIQIEAKDSNSIHTTLIDNTYV